MNSFSLFFRLVVLNQDVSRLVTLVVCWIIFLHPNCTDQEGMKELLLLFIYMRNL